MQPGPLPHEHGPYVAAESVGETDRGYDWREILECEGDSGLGNGGLGRLAACLYGNSPAMLQRMLGDEGFATTSACLSRRSKTDQSSKCGTPPPPPPPPPKKKKKKKKPPPPPTSHCSPHASPTASALPPHSTPAEDSSSRASCFQTGQQLRHSSTVRDGESLTRFDGSFHDALGPEGGSPSARSKTCIAISIASSFVKAAPALYSASKYDPPTWSRNELISTSSHGFT